MDRSKVARLDKEKQVIITGAVFNFYESGIYYVRLELQYPIGEKKSIKLTGVSITWLKDLLVSAFADAIANALSHTASKTHDFFYKVDLKKEEGIKVFSTNEELLSLSEVSNLLKENIIDNGGNQDDKGKN